MDFTLMQLILLGGLQSLVLRPVLAVNETCTEGADCTATEKTICLNNVCTCEEPLWYYLSEQQKCVKLATEFGGICFENKQCTQFLGSNSVCSNVTNTCSCTEGFRWYKGKCQKYASKGESCTEADLICLDPATPLSLTCSDSGICECSDGYYDRGHDCRLKSQANEECAITNDCYPTCDEFEVPDIFSHCELGVCVEDNSSHPINASSNECDPLYKSTSTYYLNSISITSNCPDVALSDFTQQQCQECSRTVFFEDSTCVCAPGFFLLNGQCVAELGVLDTTRSYVNDSDCPIKPGKVVDGACYCRDYWFQSDTNRECKKTTLQFTMNCMDNDWCKALGSYAFCNATDHCECISQAVLNETTFYCDLRNDSDLSEICLSDADCPLYETCQNENCQCTDGFFRPNDTSLCLPKIGSSCEVRDCSHMENAMCSDNEICTCQSDNYVTNDYKCFEAAINLHDECLINLQCKMVPNSNCMSVDNSTMNCLCADGFLEINETCYARKEYGSLCSTKTDCTRILGDTFVCRNMLCQCPIGQSLQGNECVSNSSGVSWSGSLWFVILVSFFSRSIR